MDQKENINKTPLGGEWVKTISDVPISDIKDKTILFLKSPYAIPEMPPEIKIGEVLGSGTITGILGEGGFARVYKIHDQKLDLDRAVKVLLPTGKKEVSDRFLTEARITARLDHPNIVNVFRVDEWHGCPFIEMEYIDGKSLETLLKERGTFPPYAACAVGIFIAQTLKYAHSLDFTLSDKQYKGIIHRDLKPANIMLRHEGTLKLMDFGIARPISNGLHTMGEKIVGTLQYLAPEQLNYNNIDQRTDIYAVGAILYELLCGIKAFPDEGLTDLVNKKANGIYKPFGEFPISVPKKLAEIVGKCLKVNREERYLNASALLDALNAAYIHYASEQPEIALKNFMEDPGFTPVINKKEKEERSYPPKPNFQWHLPKIPKIRLPEFSLPSLPSICLPRIPRVQLPKMQFQKLREILINGINSIKGIFKETIWRIFQIWKISFSAAMNVTSRIRLIPKIASAITLGSLGGIVIICFITFLVVKQSKEKEINLISKKSELDSSVVLASNNPIHTDSGKIKVDIPEIIIPGAEEVVQSETLTVMWHLIPTTDNYIIQIDTNGQFTDSIYRQTVSTDTFCSITDFEPATYHCRVGVNGSDGNINWSSPRVISYSPVYHVPRLVAPLPGETSNNCEITFRWRKLPKTISYQITVAADSGFQQIVFDSIGFRDTFVTHIFIDTMKTFYWHVQTNKGDNWSITKSFIINDKNDYCARASTAFQSGKLSSAEKTLRKIPLTGSCKDSLAIRISEEYLQNQNDEQAKSLLAIITLKDMLVYYLKSKILIKEGDYSAALSLLDTAINSKTVFTAWEDSSNVICLRAIVAQMVYEDQKNLKNGKNAYYAWELLYKRYNSKQSHERYREALVKMNQLYYTDKIFSSDTDTVKTRSANADSLGASSNKSKKNRWWIKAKSH
jgi:serine/threonine protein kinase